MKNCYNRAPWCPIKKNQRDFQLEIFYCFYLQDRSLPQFPHFFERSTYSQCARWKGGYYKFNHNESFHKRFFPFLLNYTLVPLQSISKSAKIAMHSNLISYNKTHKIKKWRSDEKNNWCYLPFWIAILKVKSRGTLTVFFGH